VADVRGFVGIDAGVLNNDLSGYLCGRKWRVTSGEWRDRSPKSGAIEVRVELSRTGNLHAHDTFDLAQTVGNLLRNHSRSFP